MQGYNVVVVFDETKEKLLMCKRKKNPYQGLSNLVGGKIELNENSEVAAYRELWEETAITKEDIHLTHLMDFIYYLDNCYVEVFVGRLNKPVQVYGDENDLYWSSLDCNFFDSSLFAGEGNIGHILEHVYLNEKEVLI